ncbi:response regulator transcription factor [Limosilactobacillus sp. STM2_1]|uniref:Response regulator transcription factor n=1 Tax=Limosilactobacillus rudii TaxID=2759755 RepID=A0A7W3UL54_9LACO|nr:LytTR family DNA-binding domain-containing protein [Limosilactobacillus rudii]MBB1079508.1 response regulator transcription factor [Limosilactobacillus rudii]MBB1097554.1 response regulator transcription factor [Limosilactobacillus rudii]MCD7134663.1 LytTR family DNA-binding domain-containing protein [Limosilactobacillus rudii]
MNIFILEDDCNQQRHLKSMVQRISQEISLTDLNINIFSSTDQLRLGLPLPSKENVFILDLEINGIKTAGLEISKLIRQHDELANIIFITVHDEFVYTTYKYRVSALDFIAKDRGNIHDELKKDLIHINNEIQSSLVEETFTYKSYSETLQIPLKNICYFEVNPDNTHSCIMVTTDNKEIQLNYNLRELQKIDHRFFRCHRSYLVNPLQIKQIDFLHHVVIFYNGLTCPVSRRHEKALFNLIKR